MSTWSVYEFSRIYRDKSTSLIEGNLHLSNKQFESLKKLMRCNVSAHRQFFNYGYDRDREVLICQNYVGVICLPDGDQLEILPKISKTIDYLEDRKAMVKNTRISLIKMLRATQQIPSKVANNASLNLTEMPLLDVFIQLFLNEVGLLIKRGIAKSYQSKEDNLPYLKGKLQVSKQIKHNLLFKHKHYSAFDDFSPDRPENRLIRSALAWSMNRVGPDTKKLCQEYLHHLADIPPSKHIREDLKAWQRGPHFRHYETIRPWIEMIFEKFSPTSVSGTSNVLSLLFPMERIFEDYVALRLKSQLSGYTIRTQIRQNYLLTHKANQEEKERDIFLLKPDLYLTSQKEIVVADTKWKLINENLPGKKYGIKESDIYQMLAYNQTYQKDQTGSEVWLIYPKTHLFVKPLPDFRFGNGSVIKVFPFDIATGELILN